jgi:hypothetical protein
LPANLPIKGIEESLGRANMIKADTKPTTRVSSPPARHQAEWEPVSRPASTFAGRALAPGEPVIDLAHLARMTLGEKSLEAEVLALFDRQAAVLLARMRQVPPAAVAAFAHTLKGSALGIGAWKMAEAAAAVERAADGSDLAGAIEQLASAIAEAHAAIVDLRAAQ